MTFERAPEGGERLRELLKRKGLKQVDVALGIRTCELTQWIRHHRPIPRTARIMRGLSTGLECEPVRLWHYLLGEIPIEEVEVFDLELQRMRDKLPEEWVRTLYEATLRLSEGDYLKVSNLLHAILTKLTVKHEATRISRKP